MFIKKKERQQNAVLKRENAKKYKMGMGDIAFNIINYLVFIIIMLLCIFPFYYLFINTISSN